MVGSEKCGFGLKEGYCLRLGMTWSWAFPGGSVVKQSVYNAKDKRDMGLIPGSGRSSGGWHGNLPQYSCLDNATDRGGRWATVPGVAKCWTRLQQLSSHTWMIWSYSELGEMNKLEKRKIKGSWNESKKKQKMKWLIVDSVFPKWINEWI